MPTLSLFVLLLAQQDPAVTKDRKGVIEGLVVHASTKEPLRKAMLTLMGVGAWRSSVTGEDGRFCFDRLEPGSYGLKGERLGFLEGNYGASRPDATGTQIELAAGESVGLEFPLTPQAVISGRIVDEDGDPWPFGRVEPLRLTWIKGHRQFRVMNSVDVNDRGEFRIAHLAAGRYALLTVPTGYRNEEPGLQVRSQPTYYPGLLDSENATVVTLRPGQEADGYEIRVKKMATYRIRGRVLGPVGAAKTSVFAVRNADPHGSGTPEATLRKDGTFEIAGVTPGSYEIQVTHPYPTHVRLGRVDVQVGERDVDNVLIEIAELRSLKGKVRIDGDNAVPSGTPVWMLSDDWEKHAKCDQDGGFSFDQVDTKTYTFGIGAPGYIQAIRWSGGESRQGKIDLGQVSNPIEVFVSTNGAQITGIVKDVAGSVDVRLIPGNRPVIFDQRGTFHIRDIAPGVYLLFASQNVPREAWDIPEFVDQLKSKAHKIAVADGEKHQVELTLLPKGEIVELLAKLGVE